MSNENRQESPKRELYRDPVRGKICGVCVGVADYFGLEIWVVRIIAVTALLFFQFPIFIAYIVAYLVLEPKPGTSKYDRYAGIRKKVYSSAKCCTEPSKSEYHSATVQQVWKKGRVPGQTIIVMTKRFNRLENRLQIMETYITSKQFELRKEFENLST